MDHMTKATVRDLRYNFPAIERRLRRGEEIEITKRGKPIGRLVGLTAEPMELPDFVARARRILGEKQVDAVELVRYGRGEL
jgi:prevent-host-death family protein